MDKIDSWFNQYLLSSMKWLLGVNLREVLGIAPSPTPCDRTVQKRTLELHCGGVDTTPPRFLPLRADLEVLPRIELLRRLQWLHHELHWSVIDKVSSGEDHLLVDFGPRVVLRADEVLTGLSLLMVPPISDLRGEVAGLEAVLYGG